MKSIVHGVLSCGGAFNGTISRIGTRYFVRRTSFKPITQYIRWTHLWFHVCASTRRRSKHFQKPQSPGEHILDRGELQRLARVHPLQWGILPLQFLQVLELGDARAGDLDSTADNAV